MMKFLFGWLAFDSPQTDNLLDSIKYPKEPNKINTSGIYKKLRIYSVRGDTVRIQNIIDELYFSHKPFLNECFIQSIIDNDQTLFKMIFEHKHQLAWMSSLDTDKVLSYAAKAMKYDRKEIFEYLLLQHQSSYSTCVSYGRDYNARNLLEKVLIRKNFDYLELLKKYDLANFTSYVEEIMVAESKFSSRTTVWNEKINTIKTILEHCSEHINTNKVLLAACDYGHIDIVKLLVEHGADIHSYDSEAVFKAGKRRNYGIVGYLLDKTTIPQDFLNTYASLCAKIEYNEEVVKIFLEHGAYIDLDKYSVHESVYDCVYQWNKTKILYDNLSNNLNKQEEIKPLRRKI